MTPALRTSVEGISTQLIDLSDWLGIHGSASESDWFQRASSDARAALTELRKLAVNGDEPVEPVKARGDLPSLEVATEIAGRLMKLSRYVQDEVLPKAEEPAVKESVGRFLGSLYVDVIWPLHSRYPVLVPEEMKRR